MAISSKVKFGCRILSAHCQISCSMLAQRRTEQCLWWYEKPQIQANGRRIISPPLEMQTSPSSLRRETGQQCSPGLLFQEGDASGWCRLGSRLEKGEPWAQMRAREQEVGPAVENKAPSWWVETVEVSSQHEGTLVCIGMANRSLCCHLSSLPLLQPQSSLWEKSCLSIQVSC